MEMKINIAKFKENCSETSIQLQITAIGRSKIIMQLVSKKVGTTFIRMLKVTIDNNFYK